MPIAHAEAKQKLASNLDDVDPSGHGLFTANLRVLDPCLTRDNLHLSEPKISENLISWPFADDCKNGLDELVAGCIRASVSKNTQSAYRSDLKQFEVWGGKIPAELSPNFGDGRGRSGGGGCGLTVGRLGDDLDPIVECHTENEFWQLVMAIETAPAFLRALD